TSIILSGVVALTLTPSLCALMLRSTHGKPNSMTPINRLFTEYNNWFNRLYWSYKRLPAAIVHRRMITWTMLIFFCIASWLLSNSLPSGFIPNEDQGKFYAVIQTPPGSSLERTNEVAEKLQKIAEEIEDVQSVSSLAGY